MELRTCPKCARPVEPDASYCAECGRALVSEPVLAGGAAPAKAEADEMPTAEVPVGHGNANGQSNGSADPAPIAWGYGEQPPMPPMPPMPPVYQHPAYPAPPPSGRNTPLIVGLVIASITALAGVAAALLIALGNDGEAPVRAENAAATTPAQTVVTQIVRERSRRRDSSDGSSRSGSSRQGSSSPAPSSPPASSASSGATDGQRRAAAENAVRRHWSLIESGQYSAAFSLLASSATTASESTWVSEHAEDALTEADLSVSASLTSPTTARVDVLSLRTVANSGCFTWTGSYDVAKSGGAWKIAKANLTRSDC